MLYLSCQERQEEILASYHPIDLDHRPPESGNCEPTICNNFFANEIKELICFLFLVIKLLGKVFYSYAEENDALE